MGSNQQMDSLNPSRVNPGSSDGFVLVVTEEGFLDSKVVEEIDLLSALVMGIFIKKRKLLSFQEQR